MATGQDVSSMAEPKERKRREYATGSVFQRASDGRWIGTVEAGYSRTGARRRVTVSAKTEAEAKRKLRDRRAEIDRDGGSSASRRTTVKAWSHQWLEQRSGDLRPKTYAGYVSATRAWIVPTIGHKRLDELDPRDIRAVATTQRRAGLSSSTALHTHAVLSKMLRAALLEGHQVPPRVLVVERPRKAVHDRIDLPKVEAIAILEQASHLPHGSRWVAALLQGMRQGECLGLTWACVDLDQLTLDVSWQLQALPYLDRKADTFRVPDGYETRRLIGAWHLVRPKTAKGQRIIPMTPWMASALETWKAIAPASPYDLVWPRSDGRPTDPKADLEEWKALQCTAEVGHPAGRYYVTHEARHTTATLLLEAGVDPEVIKAILGHSSIITSRGYQHVSQKLARDAMSRVADGLQLTQHAASAQPPAPSEVG